MKTYPCSSCKQQLPAEDFRRDASRRARDGLSYRCRRCLATTGERLEQIDAARRASELVSMPARARDGDEVRAVYAVLIKRARRDGDCLVAAPAAVLKSSEYDERLKLGHVLFALASPCALERETKGAHALRLSSTCGTVGCVNFEHLAPVEPAPPARVEPDVEAEARRAERERLEAERREQARRKYARDQLVWELLSDEALDVKALGELTPEALEPVIKAYGDAVTRDKRGTAGRWPDDAQLNDSRARAARLGRPVGRDVYAPSPVVRKQLRRLAALLCQLPGCSSQDSPFWSWYYEATDKHAATLASPLDEPATEEEVLLIRRYSFAFRRLQGQKESWRKDQAVTSEQIRNEVLDRAARIVVDEHVAVAGAPSVDDVLTMRAASDNVIDLDAYRIKRGLVPAA